MMRTFRLIWEGLEWGYQELTLESIMQFAEEHNLVPEIYVQSTLL